jgi:aspartate aminotransferase
MKAILGHIGAWAPKAEQVATGKYMSNGAQMEAYLTPFKQQVKARLDAFYNGFMDLKKEGFAVDAITPQAAIYLTVKFELHGKTTADGHKLATTKDITAYLLEEARLAIVPFSAFGASENSPWYRISVGTCTLNEIAEAVEKLKIALAKLS